MQMGRKLKTIELVTRTAHISAVTKQVPAYFSRSFLDSGTPQDTGWVTHFAFLPNTQI